MALRAMLLSAPLPGGRVDGYCDDSGLDDYLEEELLSEGNDEDDDNNNDEGTEDPGDIDVSDQEQIACVAQPVENACVPQPAEKSL